MRKSKNEQPPPTLPAEVSAEQKAAALDGVISALAQAGIVADPSTVAKTVLDVVTQTGRATKLNALLWATQDLLRGKD